MAPKRKREDELGEKQRDWRDLPTDILIDIHQCLDDRSENKLELRRIRSVCSSWRSALPPLTPSSPKFPLMLTIPSYIVNSADYEPFTTASLSQSDLFLFPPPRGCNESAWIVKVEQRVESSKWRLENPFITMPASFEHSDLFRGSFDIFDCNVKEIARSYMLEYSSSSCDKNPKQAKAVISWNSKDKCGDFNVLVLFHGGNLGLWRPGEDAGWSVIPSPFAEVLIIEGEPSDSYFSDIIVFESKFYATTMEGRLVMINPTTYEVRGLITEELVSNYEVPFSNLVESNGRLYLVQKDAYNPSYEPEPPGNAAVYMLESNSGIDSNQTFTWKVVTNIEDRVFFASDYTTFSISVECLGWSMGNYVLLPFDDCYCLYAHQFFSVDEDLIDDKMEKEGWPWAQYYKDCLSFYSLQGSEIGYGREKVSRFAKIFWPPPDWLLQQHFEYCPYWSSVTSVSTASTW